MKTWKPTLIMALFCFLALAVAVSCGDDDDDSDDDDDNDDDDDDDSDDDDDNDDDDDDNDDDNDDDDDDDEFLFKEIFDPVFRNLLDNYASEDGNWAGDMMGDATWFGGSLCLEMGHDTGDSELYQIGLDTVGYEISLIESLFAGEWYNLSDAAIGGPCLIEAYKYEGDNRYRNLSFAGLLGGSLVAIIYPEFFEQIVFDPVAGCGSVAFADFWFQRACPDLWGDVLAGMGLSIIETVNQDYLDPQEGYYTPLWDWNEATMLMALGEGYAFSQDPALLSLAEGLIQATDDLLYDEPLGGYYSSEGSNKMGLSGNCFFALGMMSIYRGTEDAAYLNRTERILAFIRDRLCGEDICYHHLEDGEPVGSFCTGCNLFFLRNIYQFNKLLGNEYPGIWF